MTKDKVEKRKRKSTEGPPIWVESLMTKEEWREYAREYPSVCHTSEPVPYNPNYHKGGRWRHRMGGGYTSEEISIMNKTMNNLAAILAEIREKTEQQNKENEQEEGQET